MRPNYSSQLVFCMVLLCLLGACAKKPASTADVYRLPSKYKVAVAPFTQPRNPSQLISGHIPEDQGLIPRASLDALDAALRDALLRGANRQYDFIPELPPKWAAAHSEGQPGAFSRWAAYGKKLGCRYILVPQVMDWHERQGSEAGVTNSAHVRVEFYLIDTNYDTYNRSIFEEKQVGLIDNLLAVEDFVRRKGQWVSAQQLALEGMRKAVKDLGL